MPRIRPIAYLYPRCRDPAGVGCGLFESVQSALPACLSDCSVCLFTAVWISTSGCLPPQPPGAQSPVTHREGERQEAFVGTPGFYGWPNEWLTNDQSDLGVFSRIRLDVGWLELVGLSQKNERVYKVWQLIDVKSGYLRGLIWWSWLLWVSCLSHFQKVALVIY